MAAKFKTLLAIITSLLLIFAVWTIDNQIKSVVFALILGIIGTTLIFATEFAYSYRKAGAVKLGKLKSWLKVHIFIGIAGPVVIVWHTGLNFHGFGGWLAILTAVAVASGFVGRYIYRQIPRSLKGRELTLVELKAISRQVERRLRETQLEVERLPAGRDADARVLKRALKGLEFEGRTLERRILLLDTSKALLAGWRLFHVPLTLALFVGILIHVAGVLYYGKALP